MPEFVLDIDKETYDKAGSKFITVPATAKIGEAFFREIETGMLDWDTAGKSMKLPVVVTETLDKGHEDKISFGVDATGIWKGKAIYKAITGGDMPTKKGVDGKQHPVLDPMKLNGKSVVGVWVMTSGVNQKDTTKTTVYPKLQDIYPAGYKPTAKAGLGI
jgi:hypothetical protein